MGVSYTLVLHWYLRATSMVAGVLLLLSPVKESRTEQEYWALESSVPTARTMSCHPSSTKRVPPAVTQKEVKLDVHFKISNFLKPTEQVETDLCK